MLLNEIYLIVKCVVLCNESWKKAVDEELLDKSTAFDVIGDIPAYNELVEDIEYSY
ncbi:hypothetical protein [Streptococcus mutans]|uniref:hypothetical protein n=1 Tax=Streptococcus mutans TaxID=1309 RepID=UPI001D129606|nr:hypothetical protein [Streptococcus mutans]